MTINAVDRPPEIPVGKKVERNIEKEKKIISAVSKTLKENLTFDQSKRSTEVFDQYKEKYTFDNQELDYGAIAEDQVSELPSIPIDDQQYIKDETLGQAQFEDQPLDTTRISQEAWWNMDSYTAEFPSKNTNASWNWKQESFFDSHEWENLAKGFMNENLVGMLYSAAFDYDKKHPIDPEYNVFDDEIYADIINKNPNYFSKSSSQTETQYLVNQFYTDLEKYNRPYWQMFGTVLGGFTDISSVFFFSRLAKPLFASTRMNRLKKTTAILGAEEIVKQSVDQDRPNIYGAYILGANAIMQLMLPAFKGGYTLEQKNHIKNLVLHADLQDEIAIIQKNKHKKIKIK